MKLVSTKQRLRAMTLIEVLVVIAVLAIVAALLLPMLARRRPGPGPRDINCASNLKQINLALRIWEGDNNNLYPMGVSVTNGGAMELISTGNVAACFQVASNELWTTKILICPLDHDRHPARNFQALDDSHLSYFIGADVTNVANPDLILDGDDNLELGGSPLKSGLIGVSSNSSIAWGSGRHVPMHRSHSWMPVRKTYFGFMGFADGSVREVFTSELQYTLQRTSLATNRLAIP
jgi:prepilin-type N-terminal cleavage/methylation domain-containing protein